MWTIFFTSLLNLLQFYLLLLFSLLAAGHGIFAPRPGIEPAAPALEGEVLTTGPPGKSTALISSFWLSQL